jgi:Protein of unknown function (DUF1449)
VIDWFTAPGSTPFTVALLVMLGLTAVELVSLLTGVSLNDAVDELVVPHVAETVGDAPTGMEVTSPDGPSVMGRFLAWLYVGTVPVLMIAIVFLTVFGLAGLIAQHLLRAALGMVLPGIVAAPIVLVAVLPVVRACNRGLARVLPRDETSAVDAATFVGRTAVITGGAARAGMPAQARLTDQFGTTHYVLVEPEDAEDTFAAGSLVLLLRQTGGGRFSAIANPNAALVDREHA